MRAAVLSLTAKHIGVVMTGPRKKRRWFTPWARIAVVVVFGLVAIPTGSTMASRIDLQSQGSVSTPQTVVRPGVIPEPAPATPPPVEPSPTVPVPDEPSPTVPPPVEPSPTVPVPAEPSPTVPPPVEPSPTVPVPAEPSPTVPPPVEPSPTVPPPAEAALPVACEPAVGLPVVPTPEPGDTESIVVVSAPIQFEGEACIEAVRIMTVSATTDGIPTQLILQVAGSIRDATSAQVFAVDDLGERSLVSLVELGNRGASFRADLENQLPRGTAHWLVLFA